MTTQSETPRTEHDDWCERIEVDIGVGAQVSPCYCGYRRLEREVTALTAANADLTAQLAEARTIAWDWGQGVDDAETAVRKLSRMFPIAAMKEPK